ncbi:MAG: 2TM domain-containing protein [Saprospiraceae bacterium]
MSYEDEQYKAAKKRVKLKKGFYGHFSAYVLVGLFFFIMNITTDPNDIWFHFPMLGWGIGLGMHYFRVFGLPFVGSLDASWEQQEIERELQKMSGKKTTKALKDEFHEIDELNLDNRYSFDEKEEDLSRWEKYDDRDMREIRKDFDDRF